MKKTAPKPVVANKTLKQLFAGLIIFVFAASFLLTTIQFAHGQGENPPEAASQIQATSPDTSFTPEEAAAAAQEAAKVREAQKTTAQQIPDNQTCGLTDVLCSIGKGLNYILDGLANLFYPVANSFFSTVLAYNRFAFGGGNSEYQMFLYTIRLGWTIVLGVVNMFFILWLLWIAIATIFDFQNFTARKTLGNFIIAALLINFSFPIATSIIKLTNGIGDIFYSAIEVRGGLDNATKTIFNQEAITEAIQNSIPTSKEDAQTILANEHVDVPTYDAYITGSTNPNATVSFTADQCYNIISAHRERLLFASLTVPKEIIASPLVYARCQELLGRTQVAAAVSKVYAVDISGRLVFISAALKVVIIPLTLFVFFAAGIFLLIRLISLMLLIIGAPIAFFSLAVPGLGGLSGHLSWEGWWQTLLKWSFYLPVFLFLFLLSVVLIQGVGPITARTIISVNPGPKVNYFAVLVTYFIGIVMMIFALLVAEKVGFYGAGGVTKLGSKMAKGVGGWVKDRGWKIGGKAAGGVAAAVSAVPGIRRISLLTAPLRAGLAEVMKKGAAVEKKDIGSYTKIGDNNQLAYMLRSMSRSQSAAVWKALDKKRKRNAKGPLADLARERDWEDAPPKPQTIGQQQQGAEQTQRQTQQRQNQAIQNQVMPVIQGLPQMQAMPPHLQVSASQAIQRAIQGLPLGAQPQSVHQAAQGAVRTLIGTQPAAAQTQLSTLLTALAQPQTQNQIQQAASVPQVPAAPKTVKGQTMSEIQNMQPQGMSDQLKEAVRDGVSEAIDDLPIDTNPAEIVSAIQRGLYGVAQAQSGANRTLVETLNRAVRTQTRRLESTIRRVQETSVPKARPATAEEIEEELRGKIEDLEDRIKST